MAAVVNNDTLTISAKSLKFSANESMDSDIYNNLINISLIVPPEIGVPVYGYLAPVVILTTVLTNSFIVVVLSRPQLRSPTNCILLAISVHESLTGLISLPWFLYYYTFGGRLLEIDYGLPPFWCRSFMAFSEILPTIFHTSAIWLTVYLAVQRYIYVKCPTGMMDAGGQFCKTNTLIIAISICSVLLEAPMMFGRYTYPVLLPDDGVAACQFKQADWTLSNRNAFYATHYWLFAVFVYAGPCCLLVVFSGLLICTLNKTVYRRQHSLGCSGQTGRALRSTTKMLIVVIAIFLITEIPAAAVFTLHVLQITFNVLSLTDQNDDSYRSMNLILILRNVFILISYPFKFAIYLSMSQQFRSTVKALFCPKYADAELVRNASAPKPSVASNCRRLSAIPPSSCNGYDNNAVVVNNQQQQMYERTNLLSPTIKINNKLDSDDDDLLTRRSFL